MTSDRVRGGLAFAPGFASAPHPQTHEARKRRRNEVAMNQTMLCWPWELTYDGVSGQPVALHHVERGPVFEQREPMVVFFTGGLTRHNDQPQMFEIAGCRRYGYHTVLEGTSLDKGDSVSKFTLELVEEGWGISLCFRMELSWVALSVTFTNLAGTAERLQRFQWNVGMIDERLYSCCELLAPGYPPSMKEDYRPFRSLAEYREDDILTEGDPCPVGIIGVYHRDTRSANVSWVLDETFYYRIRSLRRSDCGQLQRITDVFCPADLEKGQSVTIGDMYYGNFTGSRLEIIREVSACYRRYWHQGKDVEKRRSYMAMEVTLGEKLNLSPFPDYAALEAAIPGIRKAGFNALQIMPWFPYPGYSVHDWKDVDTTYGSSEGLRHMIRTAHAHGMKVILDVVLHGPYEYDADVPSASLSPFLTEHPEWFSVTDRGGAAHSYTRSLDQANPELRQYLLEALRMYLEEYGADGFRFDAQLWNIMPNWEPQGDYLPYAGLLSGNTCADFLRQELIKDYPEVIFYCEGRGPVAGQAHDYRYSYDFWWVAWGALAPIVDSRGSFHVFSNYMNENSLSWPDFAQWYEEEMAAEPEGLTVVHHIDSHDLHEKERLIGGRFARELYGMEMHRVLFGIIAFLGDALMSYYGAQFGSEDFYHKVLGLRSDMAIFRRGKVSCTGLSADDGKTASILWEYEKQWGFYLGNLENRDKEAVLRWMKPKLPEGEYFRLKDVLGEGGSHVVSRRQLCDGMGFALPPCAAQLWIAETVGEEGRNR